MNINKKGTARAVIRNTTGLRRPHISEKIPPRVPPTIPPTSNHVDKKLAFYMFKKYFSSE